ncbi:MAG: hypothetical protein K9G48_10365 [Reyranella sp.]|nr:hypothetical protein [Reyranella sp.]
MINQSMINKGICHGLIAVFAAALLGGCGLFDGGPSPLQKKAIRPGADRAVAPSSALPPAPAGRSAYDGGGAVGPEKIAAPIGSIVSTKGGQQSQKEALEKQAMERDAAAREARERARAARERGTHDPGERPAGPPAEPSSDVPASISPASTAPPSAVPPSDRPPS